MVEVAPDLFEKIFLDSAKSKADYMKTRRSKKNEEESEKQLLRRNVCFHVVRRRSA